MTDAPDASQTTRPVISQADAAAAGKVRFYTGKPCLRGHMAERSVHNGQCIECLRIHSREHRGRVRETLKKARERLNQSVA